MKKSLVILVAFITCGTAFAQHAKRDTVFFDDFSSNKLNRSKWNVEVTGTTVNDEQQAYVDSAATLYMVGGKTEGARNGALVLKAVYKPGHTSKEHHTYDFISGRINTRDKMMFTYGSFSARMKMTAGAGLWPAFWALGKGNWPDCGEIDVMETVGDSSWTSNALHGPGYFGNTPLAYRAFFPRGFNVTQWHVYSADWSADKIVFKVDGRITYMVTKAMAQKYGRWAFDNPKFLIVNFAIGGGYPNGVNKVTKPYFGLSQSSVDKIKAGKALVYVDWVLLTKAP